MLLLVNSVWSRRHATFMWLGACGVALSLAWAVPVCAAALYVDPNAGVDTHDGLTPGSALSSIQAAVERTQPGDTVFLMDGIHTGAVEHVHSNSYSVFRLDTRHSGAPGAPVIYTAMPGHDPVIRLDERSNRGVQINGASHITIEGLRFEGNNRLTSFDHAATLDPLDHRRFNTGILMGAEYVGSTPTFHNTHNVIRNNEVAHFGAHGIDIAGGDYITVEGNNVHHNGLYSNSGHSGVNVTGAFDTDGAGGHKIVIRGNTLHHNENLFPFFEAGFITDGNGLIVDHLDFYGGRVLVENNLAYRNGGAGLQALKSERVDFINNTAVLNSLTESLNKGNIDVNWSNDIRVVNNIMLATEGDAIHQIHNSHGLLYVANLHADEDGVVDDQQFSAAALMDFVGFPGFVDLANMDLRLTEASDAVGQGWTAMHSEQDFLDVARLLDGAVDVGAYEFAATRSMALLFSESAFAVSIPEPATVSSWLVLMSLGLPRRRPRCLRHVPRGWARRGRSPISTFSFIGG